MKANVYHHLLLLLLSYSYLQSVHALSIPRQQHLRLFSNNVIRRYKNETRTNILSFRTNYETRQDNGNRATNESTDDSKELQAERTKGFFSRQFWKTLQVGCVLMAINVVLQLRIERPILTRLPSSILIYLIEIILEQKARAKVLRVVALELDGRIRDEIRQYTGNDYYHFGDLTKATILKYTKKEEYQFGDLTKESLHRFTGKHRYQFGDISKTVVAKLTGKETYRFGDVTLRVLKQLEKQSASSGSTKEYRQEVAEELKLLQSLRTTDPPKN